MYDVDLLGQSPMHLATNRSAQDLLIKHAVKLEEKGLKGGVQGLLRMRCDPGISPIDVHARYLNYLLEEAVRRDGEVMYHVKALELSWIRIAFITGDRTEPC